MLGTRFLTFPSPGTLIPLEWSVSLHKIALGEASTWRVVVWIKLTVEKYDLPKDDFYIIMYVHVRILCDPATEFSQSYNDNEHEREPVLYFKVTSIEFERKIFLLLSAKNFARFRASTILLCTRSPISVFPAGKITVSRAGAKNIAPKLEESQKWKYIIVRTAR